LYTWNENAENIVINKIYKRRPIVAITIFACNKIPVFASSGEDWSLQNFGNPVIAIAFKATEFV